MNGEKLLRAIGNISDELIEGAEEPPVRSVNWTRWGALAAAAVIVAGLALAMPHLNLHQTTETTAESTTTTEETAPESMETPMMAETPEAEEPAASDEAEAEEFTDDYRAETVVGNGDAGIITVFADSFEPTATAIDGGVIEINMPDTLADIPLIGEGGGEYFYTDGQRTIRVTVSETSLTTLEDGYLSDFITNGERMYLTPEAVSHINGYAVCIGETPEGVAAQMVLTTGNTTVMVSMEFTGDVDVEDAIVELYVGVE